MNRLCLSFFCLLLAVSCQLHKQLALFEHQIHFEKDTTGTNLVVCYADNQKLFFNDELLDDKCEAMLLYKIGRYAYVMGDLIPNSTGWTVRYSLHRVDTQTLETKHIGRFAAIHFDKNGFKAATTRLTNPDANCCADMVFAIRDNYYDSEGKLVRKGKNEYYVDDLEKEYSDTLVNAYKVWYFED